MDGLQRFYLGSDTSRGDYDVAAANLQAAVGLRGAEKLDVGYVITWLDHAAKQVHDETLRHSYQFRDNPADFENSPAYFCTLVMVTVLRKVFGIRYNLARIRDPKFQDPNCFDPDFSDSRDLFIHGMIGGPGGTCASLPVLYAAVGRRLGYPLKLVQAKGHLFVRWDDPNGEVWSPGARFNIEATCEGLRCPPDEHFRQWPVPMSEKDEASGLYLRSLTEKEEVAMFRSTRAICLWENGRYVEALRECDLALVLVPHDPQYTWQILDLYKKYRGIMATKTPSERVELAMSLQEENSLQDNIVHVHCERIRRGLPGLNLAEFGIHPKPLSYEDHRLLCDSARVHRLAQADSKVRPTLTFDPGRGQPPGVQSALRDMEQARRMNEFNRANQARLRRGLPSLNPRDYGI